LATQVRHLTGGNCPIWGLPATAGVDETWLWRSESPLPDQRGLVAIHAASRAFAEALADTVRAAGFATAWLQPGRPIHVRGVAAVLWDGGSVQEERLQELSNVATHFNPAPVIAVVSFPRVGSVRSLQMAGAAAVVSKPFANEELLWQIQRAMDSGRGTREELVRRASGPGGSPPTMLRAGSTRHNGGDLIG
jgi:DNA-binding NarL/FixJ family response regulator